MRRATPLWHPSDHGEKLESQRLKARLSELLLAHELLEQNITTKGRPPFGSAGVEAMSRAISTSSGKPHGLALVCRIWRTACHHLSAAPSSRRTATRTSDATQERVDASLGKNLFHPRPSSLTLS